MTPVSDALKQLELLSERVKPSSRKKISDQQWQKFYDQLSALFVTATPEERVDLHIAFEDRDLLIESLVKYLSRMAEGAARLARRGRLDQARPVLQRAIIADAIIDGRASVEALDKLHKTIIEAAQQLKFDMNAYLTALETPVSAYVQRAYQHHKQENRISAIRSLGRALQLDESLRRNPRIGDFATILTGEDTYSAILTLEDSFTRNRFIDEVVIPSSKKLSTGKPQVSTARGGQLSLIRRLLYGVFAGRRSS